MTHGSDEPEPEYSFGENFPLLGLNAKSTDAGNLILYENLFQNSYETCNYILMASGDRCLRHPPLHMAGRGHCLWDVHTGQHATLKNFAESPSMTPFQWSPSSFSQAVALCAGGHLSL